MTLKTANPSGLTRAQLAKLRQRLETERRSLADRLAARRQALALKGTGLMTASRTRTRPAGC